MFTKRFVQSVRTASVRRDRGPKSLSHLSPFSLRSSEGFTLIELIVIMVVVSIVAVALFGVITSSVARSADPMLRMQAIAVAQGYLEEALLQPYAEPPDGSGESGGCESGESRTTYDDVQDYDCINGEVPTDQFGISLGLGSYTVDVAVGGTPVNGVTLQRVDVTVDYSQGAITLTGYRGNY